MAKYILSKSQQIDILAVDLKTAAFLSESCCVVMLFTKCVGDNIGQGTFYNNTGQFKVVQVFILQNSNNVCLKVYYAH